MYLTLLVCTCPIMCHCTSLGICSHLSVISWILFSPKIRCPPWYASIKSDTGFVFETATKCTFSGNSRSEEHTSELQSRENIVCLLLFIILLFPYTTLFRSYLTLLVCTCPIMCHCTSLGICSHLSVISWILFSPKIRCPPWYASIKSDTGFVFETATKCTFSGNS